MPLPGDRFRNIDRIDQVHCPTLIMHGTADEVVPFWHGPKLLAAANDPKLYLWVQNGGHNTLLWDAGNAYWEKMAELVRLVQGRASRSADKYEPAGPVGMGPAGLH